LNINSAYLLNSIIIFVTVHRVKKIREVNEVHRFEEVKKVREV